MAKKTKLVSILLLTAGLYLFHGCANQQAPGGGEVDTIPPQIIESIPLNGTTNYHDNNFELKFSEYVDKRSVQDAVFISPSLQYNLEYDWSGKSVNVHFRDTLKENTTYTVSIGTDVRDLNNSNKMAEAYTFAFSTGNKIHKGKISGKVYDANSQGVMIFAYKENGKEIDPSKERPDYLSQVGKIGKFTLLGLNDGGYKVFAVRDRLRDQKYHKNEDDFGVQFRNISIDEKFSETNDVDFFLAREDTIQPKISNVIMKDRNHLLVEFSDKIDSTKLSAQNFYLFDSTANKKIVPAFVFKGDAKPFQYYLGLTDTLANKEGWILYSEGITDFNANVSIKEKNSITVKNVRDTVSLKVLRVNGELASGKVDYENSKLNLLFNDAVNISTVKERLSITDEKGTIYKPIVTRVDDASYDLFINEKLKQSADYTLKFNLKNYTDYCGNKIDSLFQNKFSTAGELDFSGVSGTVAVSDTVPTIVVIESSERIKKSYQQKTGANHGFDFKKVNPGKYLAWSYKDKNKNGKYDTGTIIPFRLSEEFKFYPDTLNLRARWPVGGVNIDFQK